MVHAALVEQTSQRVSRRAAEVTVPVQGSFRRVALPLAIGGVAIVALEAIPEPERTLFWRTLFDLGHAPLFGVVALQARRLLVAARGEVPGGRRSVEALAIAAGLGIATEVVQMFQPARDASLADVLRDIAGAAAFLLLRHASRAKGSEAPQPDRPRRIASVAVAVLLLAAVAVPFLTAVVLYTARRHAFPTLYALDGSWWERRLIRVHGARLEPASRPPDSRGSEGGPLARVDFDAGRYPGIVFNEPYPDWSGYRRLVFVVRAIGDAPITLTLRIHDARHDQRYSDRFNRDIEVGPGERRVVVTIEDIRRAPRGREMDLTRIRGIVLFAYRLDRPASLSLGPLRLE